MGLDRAVFRSRCRAMRFNACRADHKGFGGFRPPLPVGERVGVRGAGLDPLQDFSQDSDSGRCIGNARIGCWGESVLVVVATA